jgi:hypothetical protein
MAATGGDRAQAQRRRAGDIGGHPGPARLHLRSPRLRYAGRHLRHLFPYLPGQSGYNKRLRRTTELLGHLIRAVARDTSLWSDDVWVVDSTAVECGRSRETAKGSALAGWAQYGYCASHSRYFWGLRLHLVCTLPWLAGRGRVDRCQG